MTLLDIARRRTAELIDHVRAVRADPVTQRQTGLAPPEGGWDANSRMHLRPQPGL
jgi:hypothetical protein